MDDVSRPSATDTSVVPRIFSQDPDRNGSGGDFFRMFPNYLFLRVGNGTSDRRDQIFGTGSKVLRPRKQGNMGNI